MNLEELEKQKLALLSELTLETVCDFIPYLASDHEKHMKTCKACQRKRQIGTEYEKLQKQIKRLQGRTNAPTREIKVKISPHIGQLAKRNGINRHTLYRRIRKGMDPRVAATKPLQRQNIGVKEEAK